MERGKISIFNTDIFLFIIKKDILLVRTILIQNFFMYDIENNLILKANTKK